MAQTELWMSPNFWQPPRRSWPFNPTRLEILAEQLGIDDEEFRALLQGEVQRRLRERGEAGEKLDRTLEKRETPDAHSTPTRGGIDPRSDAERARSCTPQPQRSSGFAVARRRA